MNPVSFIENDEKQAGAGKLYKKVVDLNYNGLSFTFFVANELVRSD